MANIKVFVEKQKNRLTSPWSMTSGRSRFESCPSPFISAMHLFICFFVIDFVHKTSCWDVECFRKVDQSDQRSYNTFCTIIKSLFHKHSFWCINNRQLLKKNLVGKGEIAHLEQFLLFPQCFLINQRTVSPFVHIFDIISLFAAELEKPKIGISGKGPRIFSVLYSGIFWICQ